MSRYNPNEGSDQTLEAAQQWATRCLVQDGSVFSDLPLWTAANFNLLERTLLDHPLEGPANFYAKLHNQLEQSSPTVKQLAAECLWLLLLFVGRSGYSSTLKRQRVTDLWRLSGTEMPETGLMSDAAMSGIGWPGTAFLTRIHDEFGYLLTLMARWKELTAAEQSSLFLDDDPWPLCTWVTSQRGGERRIFRHMLLHLLRPDSFERICSRQQKRQIFDVFSERMSPQAQQSRPVDPCALDKALLEIRRALEAEFGTAEIDFYNAPLAEIWSPEPVEPPTQLTAVAPQRQFWIEKVLVSGRPDRHDGENALGRSLWSPQRSTSGGDIYSTMRRVREGDVVFHLIDNRAVAGVSTVDGPVDDSFIGLEGTPWSGQAGYRVPLRAYQALEPPLQRASFLETEPFRTQLSQLVTGGTPGLFFNRKLELNQGSYLTEAPHELVAILNAAYEAQSGKSLPYVEGVLSRPPGPTSPDVSLEDLFLEPDEINRVLTLWRAKKNVILQGPPGVGKSFAARRLAYALMQSADHERVDFVQFHQSYSYEDFVEGFRPSGNGFVLRQGKFVEFCQRAARDVARPYVFVIDEINRGNLSKILGELMLLIEPDKRDAKWSMALAYGGEPFHVPANVHLLGLMNTADRSLAVVDYALRRRFAFVNLEPKLHSTKFLSLLSEVGVDEQLATKLLQRIGGLNDAITQDVTNLGPGFAIGHSFFCDGPSQGESAAAWYERVVLTEIVPLLQEYWFDVPTKVEEWEQRLLAD